MSRRSQDGGSAGPIDFRMTLPAAVVFVAVMVIIYLLAANAVKYEQVMTMEGTTAVTEVEPSSDVVSSRQQISTLLGSP